MPSFSQVLRCSFCDKSQEIVKKLISAPDHKSYICDECIETCLSIMKDEVVRESITVENLLLTEMEEKGVLAMSAIQELVATTSSPAAFLCQIITMIQEASDKLKQLRREKQQQEVKRLEEEVNTLQAQMTRSAEDLRLLQQQLTLAKRKLNT